MTGSLVTSQVRSSFGGLWRGLLAAGGVAKNEGPRAGIRATLGLLSRSILLRHRYSLYEKVLDNRVQAAGAMADPIGTRTEAIHLPITLVEFELAARWGFDWGTDPRGVAFGAEQSSGSVVFRTVDGVGRLVNQTGMTLQAEGSVYEHVRRCVAIGDTRVAYAGYSETAPQFRRRGVYALAHERIYDIFCHNGIERVVLLEGDEQLGPRSAQEKLGAVIRADLSHVRVLGVVHHWSARVRRNPSSD